MKSSSKPDPARRQGQTLDPVEKRAQAIFAQRHGQDIDLAAMAIATMQKNDLIMHQRAVYGGKPLSLNMQAEKPTLMTSDPEDFAQTVYEHAFVAIGQAFRARYYPGILAEVRAA
jgi:hypothetical protein